MSSTISQEASPVVPAPSSGLGRILTSGYRNQKLLTREEAQALREMHRRATSPTLQLQNAFAKARTIKFISE